MSGIIQILTNLLTNIIGKNNPQAGMYANTAKDIWEYFKK